MFLKNLGGNWILTAERRIILKLLKRRKSKSIFNYFLLYQMKKIVLIGMGIFLLVGAGFGWWYFQKYDNDNYEHIGFFPTMKLKPIWERKIKTNQEIRFGVITDTHVHPKRINRQDKREDAPRYLKDKLLQPLNKFVADMIKFKPNFVVHLGDVIEGTNDSAYVGKVGLDLVREQLEKIGVPIYWVIGNHDLRSVTKDEFKETLGLGSLNQVIDKGDYRFIVLDGNFKPTGEDTRPGKGYIPGFLPDKIFEWLEPKLQTDKQVVIFLHFTAIPQVTGKSIVGNGERLQKMLSKYKVVAIFNGHIETKIAKEFEGVKYFSLPGTKKSEEYKQCFYEVYLKGREVKVKMFYVDPETKEMKEEWLR
jgi:Icc-related predicted phosphoesterase